MLNSNTTCYWALKHYTHIRSTLESWSDNYRWPMTDKPFRTGHIHCTQLLIHWFRSSITITIGHWWTVIRTNNTTMTEAMQWWTGRCTLTEDKRIVFIVSNEKFITRCQANVCQCGVEHPLEQVMLLDCAQTVCGHCSVSRRNSEWQRVFATSELDESRHSADRFRMHAPLSKH